jgi:hypothetical protein
MAAQEIPLAQSPSGWCPGACKLYVAFKRLGGGPAWPEVGDSIPGGRRSYPNAPEVLVSETWACQVCRQTIVIFELKARQEVPSADGSNYTWDSVRRWRAWPVREPRELDPYVPDKIRSLYAEASRTEEAGALRAAAVMYRATVEEICADKGAQGRDLKQKITDLEQRGVSPDLVKELDEARFLGNWSIHQGVEFAQEEVADVASLIDDACFEIYVQPAQRRAMRDQRKARRDANPRT